MIKEIEKPGAAPALPRLTTVVLNRGEKAYVWHSGRRHSRRRQFSAVWLAPSRS